MPKRPDPLLQQLSGGSPLTIPTFLKVGALLRLAKRSGINVERGKLKVSIDPFQRVTDF